MRFRKVVCFATAILSTLFLTCGEAPDVSKSHQVTEPKGANQPAEGRPETLITFTDSRATQLSHLNHGENTPPWPQIKITLSYRL